MRSMCVALLVAAAGSAASAQVISWNNPLGGAWTAAGNWSPAMVPNTTTADAVVSLGGAYDVFLGSANVSVNSVTISNPSASVSIGVGRTLTANLLDIDGTIAVNPLQGTSTTALALNNAVGLTGSGRIQLWTRTGVVATNSGRFLMNGPELFIPAGITVEGSGEIIANTFSNTTLTVDGEIRSLPGMGESPLEIDRFGVVDLSGGGELIADASTLFFNSGTIRGGTIREVNAGSLDLGTTVRLDNVTVDVPGAVEIPGGRTLVLQNGTVLPNGASVNPDQGSSTTVLQIDDDATPVPTTVDLFTRTTSEGTNTGRLLASIRTLDIPVGTVVRGSGEITNNTISGNTLVVGGEVRALPGRGASPLQIQSRYETIDLSSGGELIADGATLRYTGGTIADGTIREINGGLLDLGGTIRLSNVNVIAPGTYQVFNGRTLVLQAGTTLPAGVVVNPNQGTTTTALQIDDDATPMPPVVDLFTRDDTEAPNTGRLTATIRTVEIPAGSSIRGSGEITNSAISNNTLVVGGEVRALQGRGASPLVIRSRYSPVDLSSGGELVADGGTLQLEGNTVVGGTIRELNGGSLEFNGSSRLDGVNLQLLAPLDIDNGRTLFVLGGTSSNQPVRVNPEQGNSNTTLELEDPSTIPSTVELFTRTDLVNGNTGRVLVDTDQFTIPEGTVIEGSGNISHTDFSNNTLTNAGTIRAVPGNGAAPLTITSRLTTYIQTETGRFEAFVDPFGDLSTAIESDDVQLSGTLAVSIADGYVPQFADIFEIFENRGTGEFDTVELPELDSDLVPFVFYQPDGVFLAITCVADENQDLVVDIFDILDFLNTWNLRRPGSDFNEDGRIDIFDVLAFLTEWNMNCA